MRRPNYCQLHLCMRRPNYCQLHLCMRRPNYSQLHALMHETPELLSTPILTIALACIKERKNKTRLVCENRTMTSWCTSAIKQCCPMTTPARSPNLSTPLASSQQWVKKVLPWTGSRHWSPPLLCNHGNQLVSLEQRLAPVDHSDRYLRPRHQSPPSTARVPCGRDIRPG